MSTRVNDANDCLPDCLTAGAEGPAEGWPAPSCSFSKFRRWQKRQQGRTSVSRAAAVPQSAICAIRATVLSGEAWQTTGDFVLGLALKDMEIVGALHAFCIFAL